MRFHPDPCVDFCEHAKAVGADVWSSCGGKFCDHYVLRTASEEMLLQTCWLHGQTLWRQNFETLRWECPLDGCDARLSEEGRVRRRLGTILVPPLFGFGRMLP